jgi:hypothetical protein
LILNLALTVSGARKVEKKFLVDRVGAGAQQRVVGPHKSLASFELVNQNRIINIAEMVTVKYQDKLSQVSPAGFKCALSE